MHDRSRSMKETRQDTTRCNAHGHDPSCELLSRQINVTKRMGPTAHRESHERKRLRQRNQDQTALVKMEARLLRSKTFAQATYAARTNQDNQQQLGIAQTAIITSV